MSKTHLITSVSPSSFDLPLYISEIPQHDLAAALMRNLCNKIDFTIVQSARSLFKSVREEVWNSDCSLDSLADLNSAFNEQSFAEDSFREAGSSNAGAIETIQSLWPLRESWVEQAKELTSFTLNYEGQINKFTPKDIEEQICEPEAKVAKSTEARIAYQVDKKAKALNIDDEAKERTYQRRIKREEANNANMVKNMKTLSAGVVHMLHLAIAADKETVTETKGPLSSTDGVSRRVTHVAGEPDFHLLPYSLRYKMICETIQFTELQAEWACKNKRLSEDEFIVFDMLCDKAISDLRGVITSPQFRIAMAQIEAGEAMTG